MVDGAAMCSGGGLPATSGTRSVGSHGGGREDTVMSWCTCLCGPHLLYIVPARQGPTTQLGWAPPTREPSQGSDSVESVEINTNNLCELLSLAVERGIRDLSQQSCVGCWSFSVIFVWRECNLMKKRVWVDGL